MIIKISKNAEELGKVAAEYIKRSLYKTIKEKGNARLLLSTGASQFSTFKELVKKDVEWQKVEMFHLDEYVGLNESHKASFRRYLKERFLNHIDIKKAYFVNGEGDIEKNIWQLSKEVKKRPIDIALIGIGENAHIAFNDPPADFETKEVFIKVQLSEKCKMQQVGEGWFNTLHDVPKEAITMTVYQMMQSKKIISCVPHKVKAGAIKDTLENDLDNKIPATILKQHCDWTLFIDENSASLIDKEKYVKFIK